jgi:hypothetical protein
LFELFATARHVLLIFLGATGGTGKTAEELSAALSALPESVIDTYRIARGLTNQPAELRDASGLAHNTYGLFDGGIVLVRPDGYVGYRSDEFDPEKLKAYLGRIFNPSAAASPTA